MFQALSLSPKVYICLQIIKFITKIDAYDKFELLGPSFDISMRTHFSFISLLFCHVTFYGYKS